MTDKPRRTPDLLAVVDLGSNSFHLVVARFSHGQLTIIDRLREAVRLAEGLDQQDRLSAPVVARAMACIERFGQRLRALESDSVRAVGTRALRTARRKAGFLERARAALGHPIEIISGSEEARLVYVGVAMSTPSEGKRRLVLDIGGGSTEVVIGEAIAACERRGERRDLLPAGERDGCGEHCGTDDQSGFDHSFIS